MYSVFVQFLPTIVRYSIGLFVVSRSQIAKSKNGSKETNGQRKHNNRYGKGNVEQT